MTTTADTISPGAFARALVRLLPNALAIPRGFLKLATIKGDTVDSIGLQLERCARRHPRRVALRFEDRAWTYAEFNGWANRIAHVLRSRGVVAGDCVAVLMENRPEVLACAAGIVKIGAVAGMLNHQQRGDVLEHSLRLTKADLLIVGDECLAALESTSYGPKGEKAGDVQRLWDGAGGAPFGYQNLRTEQVNAPSVNLAETQGVVAKSAAFYIFTSGTTGMPKASIMSHLRWLKSMTGLGQVALRLGGDDVFYCALPLYHNNALTLSWGAVLGSGCTLALGRKFSASKFWDEVRQHDATAFCYIGETLRYLLNRPERPDDRDHRVRMIVGNGLRPEIWDAFQQRFGIPFIAEFYSASEANVAFINALGLSRTVGFCPLPFAVVEYDAEADAPVRGPDGCLRRVPRGGVGLLIAQVNERAPYDGYTDAGASERKLLRDVFEAGDLWYNSGDLVRDQGFRHIAFVDRVGDTFRWKGENVATTEVEAALNHHPHVEHAVVYGVQVPGMDGRAGMVSLTWRGGDFDGAGLAAFLRERLPAYAVPLFVRLRPEQEVTGTFKFRKVEIRDEGFDPGRVSDPLYVLGDGGYEPLTAEGHTRIRSGDVRF
ncbi:MAG TPA: long-chain-acyl-CoA synthetase [Nevskiaceae bacterium]|nr:long-chain-acyl-CoA synthetase [Nevskiaceae bacterium]